MNEIYSYLGGGGSFVWLDWFGSGWVGWLVGWFLFVVVVVCWGIEGCLLAYIYIC